MGRKGLSQVRIDKIERSVVNDIYGNDLYEQGVEAYKK